MPHNDPSLLRAALIGYTQELHRVEQAMSDIRASLGQRGTAPVAPPAKKRTLSKEASKRISAAQKKRWEAYRKEKASQA